MELHHPNIVKLMAATRTDTHILLANEYIHGDNLEKILYGPTSKVQISEEDKLYVGLELMQALQYIHSKNIIHQDIKPANILVEARTKKTLLTDWGMANIRITICPDMYEKIGQLGGTVFYMAPECLMQGKPASRKSDMWSGGATVVELFTKAMPWTTRPEIFHDMNLKRPPQSLASMNFKQLPLLKSCFSYEPRNRPSAADMVVAMKNMKGMNLQKRYGFAW
ncbi:serine/threonine-protein kinase mos-like [Hyperolius riggenbachi]|uniref:serine/threonine-protein kinase mos-like n=1 Tax=Hyperolius riggenbachi TaxID=752182 RepID=UPI0035A306D9